MRDTDFVGRENIFHSSWRKEIRSSGLLILMAI